MRPRRQQPVQGSSPIVNAAAGLFILVVTVPIGCAVLFLGGFFFLLFASQLPEWQVNGLFLLYGLFLLVLLALALPRIVRGVWARRRGRS